VNIETMIGARIHLQSPIIMKPTMYYVHIRIFASTILIYSRKMN